MNIHVNNLSKDITEFDLRQAFKTYGQVAEVTIVREKVKSKLRVTAEVVMPNELEAEMAISVLHGKNLKKRPMKIAHAKSRPAAGRHIGARRNPGDKLGGTKSGGKTF